MKFRNLKTLRFISFYKWQGGLPVLVPFIGYILLGPVTVYFLSVAMKQMPAATAFAVWTASTLIFLKVAELVFFKHSISLIEVFFMLLIIAGIIGLKIYAVQPIS
jgi:multidrug transporter EmrE-like cation transporter